MADVPGSRPTRARTTNVIAMRRERKRARARAQTLRAPDRRIVSRGDENEWETGTSFATSAEHERDEGDVTCVSRGVKIIHGQAAVAQQGDVFRKKS